MVPRQHLERPTVRLGENCTGGRDFVAGDVHGEFEALEATLANLGFQPDRDRLFARGDLVDRGLRSADALAWMETGRITLRRLIELRFPTPSRVQFTVPVTVELASMQRPPSPGNSIFVTLLSTPKAAELKPGRKYAHRGEVLAPGDQ